MLTDRERTAEDGGDELAQHLVGEGVGIGGALEGEPVQGRADRGALDIGTTIAVLGCGADVAYPASHRSLWRTICERGLVVSELPPGATPWRWTFPARNRIIAGLAGMTVVVEAAERSGSLIAAGCASRFERQLGAVPGPVTSRASGGANCLLSQGAHVVRGAEDILFVLRGDSESRRSGGDPPTDRF